jgi:glycosyltransferase involved in cell wall biosynthesis
MSVSVVICCHNSSSRLAETLGRLRHQTTVGVPWELLIVDNASTDGTAETAVACWRAGPAPLRILREPQLGLGRARIKGLREARYEIVSFVDDDNWVASDWVANVDRIMAENELLGAVGGLIDPVFEKPPPSWFECFKVLYAVVNETEPPRPPICLCGAGLNVRKAAWQELVAGGFRPLILGRVGDCLSGGEDNELTHALKLAGWQLAIDNRLRMQHWLPAARLSWSYLRRRAYESSRSEVLLTAYLHYLLFDPNPNWKQRLRHRWWWTFGVEAVRLFTSRAYWSWASEGDPAVIASDMKLGELAGLLSTRGACAAARRDLANAAWRQRAFQCQT